MKFFLDHDVPDRLAGVIQHAGHEVTRVREVLPVESDDATVLEFACRGGLILVTCNRDDFLQLAKGIAHPGIIFLIRRKSRIAECSAFLRLIERAGFSGLTGNFNYA